MILTMSSSAANWPALLLLFFHVLMDNAQSVRGSTLPNASGRVCSWTSHGSPYPLLIPKICPVPFATNNVPADGGRDGWSPWSHKPYCLGPEAHEDDEHRGDETNCVFTYSSFRGNTGISLVTTPELAASVVDALDDAFVSPEFRDHPSSPLSSSCSAPGADGKTPFEIRDLPGRGKGVVARRKLARFETVMVGFPALLGKIDFLNGDGYTDRERHLILQRAVNQLPPDERRDVMALARSTGGDPIQNIIKTNGFGVERVNHNCRPNVFWRHSKRHMAMEVVALRETQAGEEVAHSYAPLGYTRAERQEMLRAWGFECRCAMCSAPAEHVALSDSRLERLFEIHHTLSSHASEEETDGERLSHARVDRLVSEALTLIAQEELHPQVVVYYHALFAPAYMAIGDLALARKYVALSEENWILYGGEEHDNVDGIRLLWEQLAEAGADVDD